MIGIWKKYKSLRRIFVASMFLNSFLIFTGIVAAIDYFRTSEWPFLQMALVGLGTFVFGVAIPFWALWKLGLLVHKAKTEIEETVAKVLAGFLENYDSKDSKAFQSPQFWLNTALLGAEVLGEKAKNPSAQVLAEFAPIVRKEILRSGGPKKKKKSKKAA